MGCQLLLLAQFINLLNFDSVTFLLLYVPVAFVLSLAALALRWWLRQGNHPGLSSVPLNEYEIAYLAGGRSRAAKAAAINLVRRGCLHALPSTRELQVAKAPPNHSHPLEHAVAENPTGVMNRNRAVDEALDRLHQHLQDLGLVFKENQHRLIIRKLSTFPVFGIVLLGFCKIMVDSLDHQSVGALVCIWVAVAVVACFLWSTPHRTQSGDYRLQELQKRHAELKQVETLNNLASNRPRRFSNLSTSTKSEQLVLAFALFGEKVLAAKPFETIQAIFEPPKDPGYRTSVQSINN